MYDPSQLIMEYERLDHGKARIAGIQYATQQADLAKDYPYMLFFRYEHVTEGCDYSDNRSVFLILPQMLQIFNEHPDMPAPAEYYGTANQMLLWSLSYLLAKGFDYYQVSQKDMELFFQEYKQLCQKYGESLISYYEYHADFYRAIDVAAAKKSFKKFQLCRKNHEAECYACGLRVEVDMELFFDHEEAALKLAAPLIEGRYTCPISPSYPLGHFVSFYINHNDLEKAAYYNHLLLKERGMVSKRLTFTGESLLVFAKTNLNQAWKFYKKYFIRLLDNNNPFENFLFARGAAVLFTLMSQEETVPLTVPKSAPFYQKDGLYQTIVLHKYYEGLARNLAEKFDERNGTDYFSRQLTIDHFTTG